jgi:hypothetical protein
LAPACSMSVIRKDYAAKGLTLRYSLHEHPVLARSGSVKRSAFLAVGSSWFAVGAVRAGAHQTQLCQVFPTRHPGRNHWGRGSTPVVRLAGKATEPSYFGWFCASLLGAGAVKTGLILLYAVPVVLVVLWLSGLIKWLFTTGLFLPYIGLRDAWRDIAERRPQGEHPLDQPRSGSRWRGRLSLACSSGSPLFCCWRFSPLTCGRG